MAFRLESLWYENDDGKYIPHNPASLETPEGATIQISRPPNELRTTWLRLTEKGSEKIATACSSYRSDLVLALCRPSLKDRIIQLIRYGSFAKSYDYNMAILLAAETCERCVNSLAHRYGLDWGYREFSDEWHFCGTSCSRCEAHGRGRFHVWDAATNSWNLTHDGKVAEAERRVNTHSN